MIEKRARRETVIFLQGFKWNTLTTAQLLSVLKIVSEGDKQK